MHEKLVEPPPSTNARFTIGQNENGWWLVCDRLGLVGGLFIDRASAVRFAKDESDGHPEQVGCLPERQGLKLKDVFRSRNSQRFSFGSLPRSIKPHMRRVS
ncbi:hypothetical protein [Agrobacterium tumefaciens]|uniref:hypothetical protein n=1 Tax=Agrobacterium tumefaciens TaxID=358 RepID=UPI0021D037E1|nr:hypothetical protein [Agrobacterium tumefaciens]UXS02419.1 hypothetical protein FY156_13565 [Agrobacterium tumefaciens]